MPAILDSVWQKDLMSRGAVHGVFWALVRLCVNMKPNPFAWRIRTSAEDMRRLSRDDDAGALADRDGAMSIDLVAKFSPQAEDDFHVRMSVRFCMNGLGRVPPRDAGNPPETKLVGSNPSVDVFVAVLAHNVYSIHDSSFAWV